MEERDLKNIWKNSSKKEDITINITQLMSNFKYKMEDRERIVRKRDLRETIGAIIIVSLFGYILIKKPFTISSIGTILMILSMIHTVLVLYNNRKSKFTQHLFLPIKEQFIQQREFMLAQAKLLRNVHQLLLPVIISYMLFEWGNFVMNATDSSLIAYIIEKQPVIKIITTLFIIVSSIYTIKRNKRAAEVNWEPLIKDIDSIIKNLDKEK